MYQFKRPRYDELAETLKLLIAFREEFSSIYPEEDIAKVAITMEEHFNEKYIDSEEYPKSTFIGRIHDWSPAFLDRSNTLDV